jgi:CubicO group peptidase (beta-lactamase class C family)
MLLTELVTSVQPLRISKYVQNKLWGPIHSENDAQWGLDAEDGLERSFAQFYATSRDFARLGKLFLDSGRVDTTQIISKEYITNMITPIDDDVTDLAIPYYGYQVWLGETEAGIKFSVLRGHRGQYVISIPSRDLVVVRTGYQRNMEKFRNLSKDIYIYVETALKITE